MNHVMNIPELTRFWRAAVFGMILAATPGGPVPAQAASTETAPAQTLYQRLGGYDGHRLRRSRLPPASRNTPTSSTCFAGTARTASFTSSRQ